MVDMISRKTGRLTRNASDVATSSDVTALAYPPRMFPDAWELKHYLCNTTYDIINESVRDD